MLIFLAPLALLAALWLWHPLLRTGKKYYAIAVIATAIAIKNGDQKAAAAKPRLNANARRLPSRPRVVMRSPRITTVDKLMTAPNR